MKSPGVEANDEEKAGAGKSDIADTGIAQADSDPDSLIAEPSTMTDIFSWQHMEYVVPIGGGDHRKLLDDVTGFVAPGKLTALMGESGAGKTTLLNVLAARNSTGIVKGDRLVNGQSLPDDFQAQTGYVQQMDTHVPTATVREALLFSAKMRQPASTPLKEKEEYVHTCLKLCGLESYADALVGSLGIEHRKRTTIGVELAAKPRLLLFLDEVHSPSFHTFYMLISVVAYYRSRFAERLGDLSLPQKSRRQRPSYLMHNPPTLCRAIPSIRPITSTSQRRANSLLWRHHKSHRLL